MPFRFVRSLAPAALFVLAMGIVAALGNEVINIVIATAIINFPLYARVARAEANVRRDAGFVEAARLSGNGETRVLLGHVLPNIMPIMMVQMSLTMGYAILNAAGLSFIGLGFVLIGIGLFYQKILSGKSARSPAVDEDEAPTGI